MIFIVIPVHNRLHFTKKCLASLFEQSYKDFKIILVDDGSNDGTELYIKEHFSEVILLKGDGNLWWTGATNLGVQQAISLSNCHDNYVLTLNNDLVVESDYLQNLLCVIQANKKHIIGSVSVDIDNDEEISFAGTKWNAITAKYSHAINRRKKYSQLKKERKVVDTDLLPGRGTLIPITVFEKIGLYDLVNFPQYAADEDFSLRCKKAGYALKVAICARVKSHVKATGPETSLSRKSFRHFLTSLSSIKSPNNVRKRWIWARKHAPIPPLYFLFDCIRIFVSYLKLAFLKSV